jgi:AcrR family transcriptional regulator
MSAGTGDIRRRLGRPPKSEARDTRELLLDAALDLFARQGFARTTVRQIAGVVGVRDSAIYAHFASKQAIYDALFAEAGPVLLDTLGLDVDTLAATHPAKAVPQLIGKVLAAWDTPRARRFASVLVREGIIGSGAGGRSLAVAIAAARQRLEEPFARWIAAGLLRDDIPAAQLVWELVTPIATIRFLYLHGQATDAERQAGHHLAEQHVAYFLSCTLRAPERAGADLSAISPAVDREVGPTIREE